MRTPSCLLPFIITFSVSVTATLEAGSPTSSSAEVTLVNSADDKVKLVGVEFGRDRISVTLQNTTDKDIAEVCLGVTFQESDGSPFIWHGTPEEDPNKEWSPCLHNLGAHSVLKIKLRAPDARSSDDLKDFKQLLRMNKKHVVASVLVTRLVFKDNSTGDHTQ